MGKKTVAELLVDTLVRREVSRIYGVAGDSLNGITDSIRRQDQLRWVPVRHEETAAFAAEPRRISPANSPSAPAAAALATCT
jgi:pyruvate dehydrogenase (quinone)